MAATKEDVGIFVLGITCPGAIMSMFLPSPSTAYDKASGRIANGPRSIYLLRRGEVIGASVSLGIAAGATLLAAESMGAHAAWIFVGAIALLAVFVWEYESAFRAGREDGAGDLA